MTRTLKLVLIAAISLCISTQVLAEDEATQVTIAELDSDPTSWNGDLVSITGEIVGDYGNRGDIVWIQVNDDPYSETPIPAGGRLQGGNSGIGVRLPYSLFDHAWGEPGGYRFRGPIVKVTGTFRYNSPDHLGETFIDAIEIELISPSEWNRIHLDSPIPGLIGGLLILVGAGLLVRSRWIRVNSN